MDSLPLVVERGGPRGARLVHGGVAWAILNGAGNSRSLESRIRSRQIGEENNGGSVMLIRNLKVSGLSSFGAGGIDLSLPALAAPRGEGRRTPEKLTRIAAEQQKGARDATA